jgi:putative spermidine/putrescine transport system substrate-binding protein
MKVMMVKRRHSCINRRHVLAAGLAAGALAVASRRTCAEEKILYVNTFGGSMEAAEVGAYYQPFTAKTGVTVRPVSPMSIAKLKAQVQSQNYEWDVSSTGIVEVRQAMLEGLLEPIDFSVVDRARIPAELFFGDCGIANMSLASCLVYRKDRYPNGGPKSWADFWDVARFPGARSLYDRAHTALAFALIADGVALDKVYPLDVERGFRKLDEIKPHIKVWWKEGSQSQQLIRDGEVDMIGMWNARAQELIDDGAPLEIVWNGAENVMGTWFVPKGTPRAKLAWQFIALAVDPERQAAYCNRLSYGPSNPKAFDFITPDNARKMPTWPLHLKESFSPDAAWLAPNLAKLRERWAQWMIG